MELAEIEDKENHLIGQTEFLESTFEIFNLKPLSIAYSGDLRNGSITIYLEFVSIDNSKGIPIKKGDYDSDIYFKVNLYEGTQLLCSGCRSYNAKKFNGYDTIQFKIEFYNAISRATSARIFVSRNS